MSFVLKDYNALFNKCRMSTKWIKVNWGLVGTSMKTINNAVTAYANGAKGEAQKKIIRDAIASLQNNHPTKYNKYADAINYITTNIPRTSPSRLLATTGGTSPYQRVVVDRNLRLMQQDIEIIKSGNQQITQILNGDRYDWDVRLRVRVMQTGSRKGSIFVFVPVYAKSGIGDQNVPEHHVGVNVTKDIKIRWRHSINLKWKNGQFLVKRGGRTIKQFDIQFEFEWVNSANRAAYTVTCVRDTRPAQPGNRPPDGTVDLSYWGADDGHYGQATAIAHEFGHMIGNPDEYGTCSFSGWQVSSNGGIMDNEHSDPKPGHFYLIASAVADFIQENKTNCYVRIGNSGTEYQVSHEHPWF